MKTYNYLQAQLRHFRNAGLTDISLRSPKIILELEYDAIFNKKSKVYKAPGLLITTTKGYLSIKGVLPKSMWMWTNYHLSNPDGIPEHCRANAKYFLENQMYDCVKSHLRLTDEQLGHVIKIGADNLNDYIDTTLCPIWKSEITRLLDILHLEF